MLHFYWLSITQPCIEERSGLFVSAASEESVTRSDPRYFGGYLSCIRLAVAYVTAMFKHLIEDLAFSLYGS